MNLTRYFPKLAALDEEQLKQQAVAQSAKTKPGQKKRGKQAAAAAAAQAQGPEGETKLDPQKLRQAILTRLNQSMEGCSKMRGVGKSRADRDDRGDDMLTDEQREIEQEKLFREARE